MLGDAPGHPGWVALNVLGVTLLELSYIAALPASLEPRQSAVFKQYLSLYRPQPGVVEGGFQQIGR